MDGTNADVSVGGVCDARFQAVREAFARNFAGHGEVGAAAAVAVDGKSVVDLWAGYADGLLPSARGGHQSMPKARTHTQGEAVMQNTLICGALGVVAVRQRAAQTAATRAPTAARAAHGE